MTFLASDVKEDAMDEREVMFTVNVDGIWWLLHTTVADNVHFVSSIIGKYMHQHTHTHANIKYLHIGIRIVTRSARENLDSHLHFESISISISISFRCQCLQFHPTRSPEQRCACNVRMYRARESVLVPKVREMVCLSSYVFYVCKCWPLSIFPKDDHILCTLGYVQLTNKQIDNLTREQQ